MDTIDLQIQQMIERLDKVAVRIEAEWGVGRLPSLCSPETQDRWGRQCDKINKAVNERDVFLLPELIEGALRGYAAMEIEAKAAGHTIQAPPVTWTVQAPNGLKIAIVQNRDDALRAMPHLQGYVVWTLDELARIIEKDHHLINVIDRHPPPVDTHKTRLSFSEDTIPFEPLAV